MRTNRLLTLLFASWGLLPMVPARSQQEAIPARLQRDFQSVVKPFLNTYCVSCHGPRDPKAKFDLSGFSTLDAVRQDLGHWQLILERLNADEMPPGDADLRPAPQVRTDVIRWIRALRRYEAQLNAGDPGPVLARRLSNAEYDYTIRDLTGIDIRPTREFPLDPANEAGFANSGESLAMSPALLDKYLSAGQRVIDHLVLLPSGITFAPHPAITYSDRDKFAVRRIVDFYLAQNTDYGDFLLAAWEYKHRDVLGRQQATLQSLAESRQLSPKYLMTLYALLEGERNDHGPLAELRSKWRGLPIPSRDDTRVPVPAAQSIRDWILKERAKRVADFPSVLIPQLNPTTQPGVLWKNRLIAEQRRSGTMTEDERQNEDLREAIERFCNIFPDTFVRTERGRMNLPFKDQNKGRLLGAGFHLQVGYYRDDRPLYDLILNSAQQAQIDQMWQELFFITNALERQFQDYIYFERAEGREVITAAEFDFLRGEDRTATSPATIEKFAKLYVAAVRERDLSDEAIAEIAQYFVTISKRIQANAALVADAESHHLAALLRFANQAWRRPVTSTERARLLEFYRQLRQQRGLNHEQAIRDVATSILVSPHFCYRVDLVAPGDDDHRLPGYALANRLSYFLWSSMPDGELLRLAQRGDLQTPSTLVSQAQRMLKDERAMALAAEFGGQWLGFHQFRNHVAVDRTRFTQFTDQLRDSMYQEPVHFLTDLIRRDRSTDDFFSANHTFVDARLAQHYGMPYSPTDAAASGWLRIDDAHRYGRGGLLPMAVFLTKNAPGLRTSPVKRGYWIVKEVLGERIPPPPPTVPELPSDESALGDKTLREVLQQHREQKSCAACHDKFDFAGLPFEAYGPIGELRTRDLGGRPVETRTQFPDGSAGEGLPALLSYLQKHRKSQFRDTLCKKLLAYGLGRTLLLSDDPTLHRMTEALAATDGKFSSLIEVIVSSRQFLTKRPSAPSPD
ncbi:MAG: hypothetical protein CMJ75_04835 [Planctomycetaceae bacterium]|nr:hypothetical protein [Planctomycetaceae bacterium]